VGSLSCDIERILGGKVSPQELLTPISSQFKRPKVIVLSGPTCSGKSALAMMLAEEIGGEIVSADSTQVYRGLNVGTAKPTEREMKAIPHHLVDVLDIHESFNVVDFHLAASHTCQLILNKGGVPIVVGGTGFYIHSLIYGPPQGPTPDPKIRARLEGQFDLQGADWMYERLEQLDIDYAKTITCHDRQKIIRALEIIEITGGKVSELKWREAQIPKLFDFRCWFLNRPKSILYDRINSRCEKMVAKGLLQEVSLLDQMGLRENTSASSAIGYRQSLEFLDSPQTKEDFDHFMETFKRASRRYAKRQLTWFRREPLFEWIDLDLHDPETAIELIMRDLES